jgi:hypothetical protein
MTGENSPKRHGDNGQFTDITASVPSIRALCVSSVKNRAKRSQLPLEEQWARVARAANGGGRTHRAKQSQFARHRPLTAPAGRTGGTAPEGERAKQSQFPQSDTRG